MTGIRRFVQQIVLASAVIAVAGFAAAWVVGVAPPSGSELGLADAGALTHWMLPAARVVRDIAMATAIGALVLASFIVAPGSKKFGISRDGLDACLAVARRACLAWAVSGFLVLTFTYSDLVGRPLDTISLAQFRFFVTDFPLAKALAFNVVVAALIPILLAVGSVRIFRGAAALLAVISIWPLATIGHASGSTNHDHAVNMQAMHVLGVSIWFGGLLTLLLVWGHLDTQRQNVVARYSRLAGWGFGLVAGSGITAAVIRVGSWSNLNSSYGLLVLAKATFLVLLGVLGWWQRRRFVEAVESPLGASRFWRLATVEVVTMVAALGAGVALGNTPPPLGDRRVTAAESLLGYRLPDALSLHTWVSTWRVDSLWVPIALLAIGTYIAWVLRLRRRGDRWPIGRTLAWSFGWLTLIWATSGAPGVYGDVLFSVHMIQHMTIATTTPILLVLGAPITLALRAIPRREDGSSGAREWLLHLIQSRGARLFGNPIFAAGLFIVGLVAFYYSGLFEYSLRSHTAHNLMLAHFLLSGYLFASVICGIDPGVHRPAYPMRILLVMVTFGFHALFAISLMNSTVVLAGDWFGSLGRTWGASPSEDQATGASIGWLLGDYPLAILAGALVWGWVRDDTRDAKRFDRQADRDGNAATEAYNDYLRALSTQSPAAAAKNVRSDPEAQSKKGANAPNSEQENA